MASYATDSYVFDKSMKSHNIEMPFTKKSILKIADINSGIYSNNDIKFETFGISSTVSYSDHATGFIHIPLVFGVYAAGVDFTGANLTETDFMLALKNSHTTLIERISIKADGKDLIVQNNNINQILAFKLHTEMTSLEEDLWGDVIGYNLDNGMVFNTGNSLSGRGYCSNNASLESVSSARASGYGQNLVVNTGAYKRMQKFSNVSGATKDFFTSRNGSDLCDDYIENGNTFKKYYVNCIIRLKDLLFFEDMPLCKGSLLQITLYVNQGRFTVNKAATTGVLTCTSMNSSGASCPLMFMSGWIDAAHNNMQSSLAATGDAVAQDITTAALGTRALSGGSSNLPLDKTYEISWGICKTTLNNGLISIVHPVQQCRLLIPQYVLNPSYESQYISLGSKKHTYYDYALTSIDVAANQNVNKYITSKNKITRIIIIPKLNAVHHDVGIPLDPSLSPFSSCPASPSPLLSQLLQNLQCEVGGENVYREHINYSYEQFLFEMTHTSNNGGFCNLASSRINKMLWENLYGYIVINVRKDEVEFKSEQKVNLSFTSICKLAMTLDVYVEYQKECYINLITGQIDLEQK